MGSSVPLRTDFDATGLRGLAHKCGDNRQIRPLQAKCTHTCSDFFGIGNPKVSQLFGLVV